MVENSYPTVPSATWQIFYKFILFFDLLHEPLAEWKNSKIWEMSKIWEIIITAGDFYEIVIKLMLHFHWLRCPWQREIVPGVAHRQEIG